jgi:hypothetical protein
MLETKHLRSSTKARNTIQERSRTRIRTKDREGNIVSFIERTKGTSLEIAQMRRKIKRG